MSDVNAFTSAQIKLAALISKRRQQHQGYLKSKKSSPRSTNIIKVNKNLNTKTVQLVDIAKRQNRLCSSPNNHNKHHRKNPSNQVTSEATMPPTLLPMILSAAILCLLAPIIPIGSSEQLIHHGSGHLATVGSRSQLLRHHTHYLNIVPSSHFQYKEGRQLFGNGALSQSAVANSAPPIEERSASRAGSSDHTHIYKRSSALIPIQHGQQSSGGGQQMLSLSSYTPLVSSSSQHNNQMMNNNSPLRRRMMSEGAHVRWTAPQMVNSNLQDQIQSDISSPEIPSEAEQEQQTSQNQQQIMSNKINEAELLRQKQHIQYHDQWPSMAGKCHKRTLNFCASVLPFNTTTFPNIIGDTNRFEVKRSLPFFGFLAKSSCNRRLDELLCLLLEPPCSQTTGFAIPPCKKFCRLALEGCNEYIPATLAMSSVFDCRQYPDSNEPSVCINLAQADPTCAPDEFKCPDKSCIPNNWLCDGVRDCIFAADEANCTVDIRSCCDNNCFCFFRHRNSQCTDETASGTSGHQASLSVCSTEEFICDGKCVPKAWRCDGERDCLDGSDEEACDSRPRCGPDRFKCADGNGCIPKRWVCDGKAECRDGSDEINCEQRQCSESDFKCDNGICIPKLWRCDRQFDCKDGSDERSCVYPAPSSSITAAPTTPSGNLFANITAGEPSQQVIDHQKEQQQQVVLETSYHSGGRVPAPEPAVEPQLIGDDVSRIIQHDQYQQAVALSSTSSSSSSTTTTTTTSPTSAPPSSSTSTTLAASQAEAAKEVLEQQQQHQRRQEMKKFDYDIIQTPPVEPMISLASEQQQVSHQKPQMMPTQIDFQTAPMMNDQRRRIVVEVPRMSNQQEVHTERFPIYRSIFKTIRGPTGLNQVFNRGQAHGPASGPHRYVVAGRRLRKQSRSQASEPPPPTTVLMPGSAVHQELERSSTPAAGPALTQNIQVREGGFPPRLNQTLATGSGRAQQHSVASYLQLLNSRYNLRLARSPIPLQPVASGGKL